ncbi:MAG: hypothetical protein MJ123_01065 [Lachnospiraceae bacterium]|nr:hypothetical protein [Lachnospiraceae bacterium]
MISLLDCTLREAPIENMCMGEHTSGRLLSGLSKADVDIIECGYLKNASHISGSTIFNTVEEISSFIGSKKSNVSYVALVDYGRYDLKYLSDNPGNSIDGIRICFKKGEQKDVISYAEEIIKRGYKVFIQHVDTADYSDQEILEFIGWINTIKPYAYSIVDTFGAMYTDDVRRIAHLVDYNLDRSIKLGFHGHNNLLMANANAQALVSELFHKRDVIIDASLLGCGRGAGNANTELIASFLNSRYQTNYDLNVLLDIIDDDMPSLSKLCSWGYSMPYVISGLHSTHVFNVNYLLKKHNIKLNDLRSIIESLDGIQRKKYDYELLDELYMNYFGERVDDSEARFYMQGISNRSILLLAPGKTLVKERDKIESFIEKKKPFVIAINGKMDNFNEDAVFFGSCKRYDYYTETYKNATAKCIVSSNIKRESGEEELIVDFQTIAKKGWVNYDSSAVLLIRFLLQNKCKDIYIAGMDGFSRNKSENYFSETFVNDVLPDNLILLDKELREMLTELREESHMCGGKIRLVTHSHYEGVFDIFDGDEDM